MTNDEQEGVMVARGKIMYAVPLVGLLLYLIACIAVSCQYLSDALAIGFEGTYNHTLTIIEKQQRDKVALKHGLNDRFSVEYEAADGTFYFYRDGQKIKFK